MAANNFIYPMKDYIGAVGCYTIDFIEAYAILFFQTNSLFISFFRYVCLAHRNKMVEMSIKPKVIKAERLLRFTVQSFKNNVFQDLVNAILTFQYVTPVCIYWGLRQPGHTVGNAKTLYICLGRYEMLFDQDLSDGQSPRTFQYCEVPTWSLSWCICQAALFAFILASSNLIEIFFLGRCLQIAKDQTNSVKSLLSLSGFEDRKR